VHMVFGLTNKKSSAYSTARTLDNHKLKN